jgi:hypothetical protein
MPDGDFMGFSGFTDIDVRGTYWYHRQLADAEDMGMNAMPFPRWYGGAVLLPDGRSYVTGGDSFSVAPRALGEFAVVIIYFRNVQTYSQVVGLHTTAGAILRVATSNSLQCVWHYCVKLIGFASTALLFVLGVLVRTSQLECCREFQSMDQGNNSC